MRRGVSFIFALVVAVVPFFSHAQEVIPDKITIEKARVIEILARSNDIVPGTGVTNLNQTIQAEIIDGPEAGKYVTIKGDYLELKVGEVFYASHTVNSTDGRDYYEVSDPYRLPQLGILIAAFVALVALFGGWQGLRGLASLVGSILCIIFLLLPGVLHGYPPILVAVGVSACIVIFGSYITHGFNRTTSTAVAGMVATVAFTGLLAHYAIPFMHLSGFTTEETVYLNMNTRGSIDMAGLLISGMLIGALGVLYDAAIGQAITVEELAVAGEHLSAMHIFRRALRIGREHIGALVNTLAIAYVGASLPLLLLFYGFNSTPPLVLINRELFATEIVRAIIGSMGLVLAVPITTAIAAYVLVGRVGKARLSRTYRHSH